MFYSEDFKKRVKETYPDWDNLHRALDAGDVLVGKYLCERVYYSPRISNKTILSATSLEELQERAKALQAEEDLYNEWCKLENEQKPE